MLRVDLDRREILASVRDLAFPPGALPRAAGRAGALRAELGSSAHRRHAADRERSTPGYRSEVVLAMEHVVDGFTLRLSGRLDGLIEQTENGRAHAIVEEVKSLAMSCARLQQVTLAQLEGAVLQARLYALMLARTRPAQVAARIVLIAVPEGGLREIPVPFDAERTARVLDRLLRRRIRAARQAAVRARERAEIAGRLRFPYGARRAYQDELESGIERALANGRPVLAEAPTGIGKTVAALLPALRHALSRDEIVFYLTAKRTQRQRVARTFEDIAAATQPGDRSLRALTLRPRHEMCPPGTLLCHVDHCPLLANLLDAGRRDRAVAELLDGHAHVAPDDVFATGERATLCPHVLARVLCAHVDLVIGDYNHVYGSASEPGEFPGALVPRRLLVVVDEAHNLLDRARGYDSTFLPRGRIATLARRGPATARCEMTLFGPLAMPPSGSAGRTDDDLRALFRDVRAEIDLCIDGSRGRGRASADGCHPTELDSDRWDALALRGAHLAARYLESAPVMPGPRHEDPVLDALDRIVRLRELARRDDPALVPYVACDTRRPGGRGLGICCVDPAARLRARHTEVAGTVMMSATLAPLAHFRDGLGLADLDAALLSLPSPFPARNRHVAVVPTVGTTWRERARCHDRIAAIIRQSVAVRPGHYVAFFPSYRYLSDVHAHLDPEADRIIVQRSGMTDAERAAVLDRLRNDPEPLLLMAVAGGIFAEGIDLPGDALIGAFVVGPSLPAIGFERDAMRRHFDARDQDGFARALLYPGMQRVIQAAGRVHRTASDRGVIVLLDHRFARPPYSECLPRDWRRTGVAPLITRDPAATLARFWSASEAAR